MGNILSENQVYPVPPAAKTDCFFNQPWVGRYMAGGNKANFASQFTYL